MFALNEFFEVPLSDAGLNAVLRSEHMTAPHNSETARCWRLGPASDCAGYVAIEICDRVAILQTLVVFPRYRDEGYGHALVDFAKGKARVAGASHLLAFQAEHARGFFEAMDWTAAGQEMIQRRSGNHVGKSALALQL